MSAAVLPGDGPSTTRDRRPLLSICIPTYCRGALLRNCLASIRTSLTGVVADVQVCVSDNGSTDDTVDVLREASEGLAIKVLHNSRNTGMARNFLSAVGMADGEFVWLLGDDDLVLPDGIETVCRLLREHASVDFFFVNSYHLDAAYVNGFPPPFSTHHLPPVMKRASKWTRDGEVDFFSLVDPRVSFDFLGGIFLSVFRRDRWMAAVGVLKQADVDDPRVFASFDATFPHLRIFAHAFAKSRAYFCSTPVSACLSGARDWAPLYSMIRSVRFVEALEAYRECGMPLWRYLTCKNYALRTFLPDMAYMFMNRRTSGMDFISPWSLLLRNAVFPNYWLSVPFFLGRRLKRWRSA